MSIGRKINKPELFTENSSLFTKKARIGENAVNKR